ncbi:hypothetical protein R6Q59_036309 [Mikania micrantha]
MLLILKLSKFCVSKQTTNAAIEKGRTLNFLCQYNKLICLFFYIIQVHITGSDSSPQQHPSNIPIPNSKEESIGYLYCPGYGSNTGGQPGQGFFVGCNRLCNNDFVVGD